MIFVREYGNGLLDHAGEKDKGGTSTGSTYSVIKRKSAALLTYTCFSKLWTSHCGISEHSAPYTPFPYIQRCFAWSYLRLF